MSKVFVQGFYSKKDKEKIYLIDNMSNVLLIDGNFDNDYQLCVVELDENLPSSGFELSVSIDIMNVTIKLSSYCQVVNSKFVSISNEYDSNTVINNEFHIDVIRKLFNESIGSVVSEEKFNFINYIIDEQKLKKFKIFVSKKINDN